MQTKVQLRRAGGSGGCSFDCHKKLLAQARLSRIVPQRGLGDFEIGRRGEDDPTPGMDDQRRLRWSELRRATKLCANASQRLVQGNTARRIGGVLSETTIQLHLLGIR